MKILLREISDIATNLLLHVMKNSLISTIFCNVLDLNMELFLTLVRAITRFILGNCYSNICSMFNTRNTSSYYNRPAYLYRFSRDIPILGLNHDFPISCGGVPILEDAGIFRARRFLVLFCFRRYSVILSASCTYRQVKARRCRYK